MRRCARVLVKRKAGELAGVSGRKSTIPIPFYHHMIFFNWHVIIHFCDHLKQLLSFSILFLIVCKIDQDRKLTSDHVEIHVRAHPLWFHFCFIHGNLLPPSLSCHHDDGYSRFCHFLTLYFILHLEFPYKNDHSPSCGNIMSCVIALCTCNFLSPPSFMVFFFFFLNFSLLWFVVQS